MIEEILPEPVVAVESFGDPPEESLAALFPQEAAVVARAVLRRQLEFADVRTCARRALGELGLSEVPLLAGKRGAPRWPDGVVGSMTHCAGYRAAALARSADAYAIGIDAEPNGPLPEGVLSAIALPREESRIGELTVRLPEICWDRLLFSAKESVYKAWYPLTGRELDFDGALIDVDPATGVFTARLLVPGPMVAGQRLTGFSGRWLCRNGLIVTAIARLTGPLGGPSGGVVGEATRLEGA